MQDRRELIQFFGAAYSITWGLAALLILAPETMEGLFGEMSTLSPVYFVAVYAPLISALSLTMLHRGPAAMITLISSLKPRLENIKFYLLVLLGWPILDTLALAVQSLVTGEPVEYLNLSLWYMAPVILLTTLVIDAGPIGEELGWRGYALPRLLRLFRSPLTVAIVLGLIWGAWHLPAFLISGTTQHDTGMGIVWLILGTTLSSVIMTYLFRKTGGAGLNDLDA